jgi:glutamine synthetase
MAGMDGILNKIDPGPPMDKTNLFELSADELAKVPTVATSLEGSLDALEADHDFLLKGGVFTPDLIETWIDWKRENDHDAVRLRPHPHEFALYFDV